MMIFKRTTFNVKTSGNLTTNTCTTFCVCICTNINDTEYNRKNTMSEINK